MGLSIGDSYTASKAFLTSANSHLTKNIEWGAALYLSQSSYGMNQTNLAGLDTDEFVASYLNTIPAATNALTSELAYEYKDIYLADSTYYDFASYNYNLSNARYGDAIFETSTEGLNRTAWFDGTSSFMKRDTAPFLTRNLFGFTAVSGAASETIGYRIVLSVHLDLFLDDINSNATGNTLYYENNTGF